PHNPLASVGRFVGQPRLRLAWFIAFARSSYWVTFYVYAPILLVEGGVGAMAGGIVIAIGNAMLFNNLLASRLARKHGVRIMIAYSTLCAAALVFTAGVFGSGRAVAAAICLLAAAFFVAILDGLGPIPFMRAVRAHERAQMTTIYRTYLDVSELLPPFVYFFAFMLFGFSGAFYALALLLAVMGALAWRHLPARM